MNRRKKIQLTLATVVAAGALVAAFVSVAPFSFGISGSNKPALSAFVAANQKADRTEDAALRTAINDLEVGENAATLGVRGAGDAQRAMSTAASAEAAGAEVEESVSAMLAAYPMIRIRIAPIESRTVASGEGWRVSIWYVATYTLDSVVFESWTTVTYEMVWEREQWLIDSFYSVQGPMPEHDIANVATPADEFEAALSHFVDNVGGDR